MEELGIIDRLIQEASNMDVANFIVVALIFYVSFYFSKKAETTFFHLLYSAFGIYMIATMEDVRVIYDVKMLVGLGLLLPQIKFIIYYVKNTYRTIKMMTANTYYFFVTIYYKILRFLNWIKSIYIMLKIFFTTFSFKKDKEKQEEKVKQEYDSYQDFNKEKKSYDEAKYEEAKQNYQERKSNEDSKQEEQNSNYQESTSDTEQDFSEQEKEFDYNKPNKDDEEFKQFFSDSAYVVLGVSASADYKTIKKVYHKLLREYHPDLNPDYIEFYTEIAQNINDAWEKVERWKK